MASLDSIIGELMGMIRNRQSGSSGGYYNGRMMSGSQIDADMAGDVEERRKKAARDQLVEGELGKQELVNSGNLARQGLMNVGTAYTADQRLVGDKYAADQRLVGDTLQANAKSGPVIRPTEYDKRYTSYLQDFKTNPAGGRPQSRWEFFETGSKVDTKADLTSLNAKLGALGALPVDADSMSTSLPSDEKGVLDARHQRILDDSGLDYRIGTNVRKKDRKGWFTGDDHFVDAFIVGSRRGADRANRFNRRFDTGPTSQDDQEFEN
jgi:hypothetical protein